jgi:hypothetical protein
VNKPVKVYARVQAFALRKLFIIAAMKYLFSLFVFLMGSSVCLAQDTIVKRNGERIAAKVLEIDKSDVKYKKFENPDGPSYILPKNDIGMIRYQNGSVDSFSVVTPQTSARRTIQPKSEMYLKGFKDADTYYTKYKPAATWTFAVTVPLNVFGILPAMALSAVPPAKHNLGYADEALFQNPEYMSGYVAGAKNKKGSKVMKGFVRGALVSLAVYCVLLGTGAIHP